MIYTLDEISTLIKPIADKYKLNAVYLFGSYARGEATENSDIDFVIDRYGTEIRSLIQLGAVYSDIENVLNKKVDVITLDSLCQEQQMPSESIFRKNVFDEMIKIYSKQ